MREKAFVFEQVLPEEFQPVLCGGCITLLLIEQVGWFQQQGHPFLFALGAGTDPVITEFFPGIGKQSLSRIGHGDSVIFLVFPYPIHHHKVLLLPVNDAGQGSFLHQFLESEASSHSMESNLFRRTADTQHRDPVTPDKAVLAQVLQRVPLTVMLRNHAQTGGATVHYVGLFSEGEGHYIY